MMRLVFWRLVQFPFIILAIYTITFTLAYLVPGDPTSLGDARQPTQEIQEILQAQYSLDKPFVFYFQYLSDVVFHFDFGNSLKHEDWRVSDIILDAFPISFQLGMTAIIIALFIGVFAGVIGAVKRDTFWDWATLSIALIGISLPTFVTGTVLLSIFALGLAVLPVGGWGSFSQLILPAITLSLPFAAYIARLTRLGMLDVLSSDFIRTARAKGVANKDVIFKHALKVAFLPVLSFLGPAAAGALTGSFIVEEVFTIPGMGQHFVAAVQNKDLFLMMGVVLLFSSLLIIFNLLVDIAYTLVDPRISYD